MKYLKIMFLGALLALSSACSTMGGMGVSVKDLDTMNKKMVYMYQQGDAVAAAFNNLYVNGMIPKGGRLYKKVDKIMAAMNDAVIAMEQAKTLEEMIQMEANALSILSLARQLLIDIAKEGVKQNAKCNICVGLTDQWSYS
jgi:hypothetical protein